MPAARLMAMGRGASVGDAPATVGRRALANVGTSMANAAQLAMDYVGANPKIGDNITLE